MCRCAFSGPYKQKWACFACRKMFRKPVTSEQYKPSDKAGSSVRVVSCPQCRAPMYSMGLDFKPPRQADKAQWKKVALLYAEGYKFGSCGCGPGPRPKRFSEVADFLVNAKKPFPHQTGKAKRNQESARDRQLLEAWRASTILQGS